MKKTILVADDDRNFTDSMCRILREKGYNTAFAYEGIRTVMVANKKKPDLILLDWKMPAGNGSAVLKRLTRNKATKFIPVIIITGVNEPGMEEEAQEYGVKFFLRKPAEVEDLIQKIEEVLE